MIIEEVTAVLDTKEAAFFKGANIALGVSMNNAALTGHSLAAAFELFKGLEASNIYAITAGELLRHALLAEKTILLQIEYVLSLLNRITPVAESDEANKKASLALVKVLQATKDADYAILRAIIRSIKGEHTAPEMLDLEDLEELLIEISSGANLLECIKAALSQQEALSQVAELQDPDIKRNLTISAINIGEGWCQMEAGIISKASKDTAVKIHVEPWHKHTQSPDFLKFVKEMQKKYALGSEFYRLAPEKPFEQVSDRLCESLIEKYSDAPELLRNLGMLTEGSTSSSGSFEEEETQGNSSVIRRARIKIRKLRSEYAKDPHFKAFLNSLIKRKITEKQDSPFILRKSESEIEEAQISLPEGIIPADLYVFSKIISREYKTGRAFYEAINKVSLHHLFKQSRRKVKELEEFFAARVFSFSSEANPTSYEGPLFSDEFKSIFTGNTRTVNIHDSHSKTIAYLLEHTRFLCDYFKLPENSPLRPGIVKGPIELKEFSRFVKQCKVLMALFYDSILKEGPDDTILSKFRNPAASAKFIQDVNAILETSDATSSKPKYRLPAAEAGTLPTELTEREKVHLRRTREISEDVLNATFKARILFGKIQTIYEKLPQSLLENYLFEDLRVFIDNYVLSAQKSSFLDFVAHHILSDEKSDRARLLCTILAKAKTCVFSPAKLNEYLLHQALGVSEEKAFEIYNKLVTVFSGNEKELFTFLFKMAFAETNKQLRFKDLLLNHYAVLPESHPDKMEASLNNYKIIVALRKKLVLLYPDLLPGLLLLELDKQDSSLELIKLYLNFLLEPLAFLKSIASELSNAIYIHLSKLFDQLGLKLDDKERFGEEHSLEEIEKLFARDPVAQMIFKQSKNYIIEECGGLLSIAKALHLRAFVYPYHIISPLEIARATTLIDSNGDFFCAKEESLLEGHSYRFKVRKVETSEKSSDSATPHVQLQEQELSISPPTSTGVASPGKPAVAQAPIPEPLTLPAVATLTGSKSGLFQALPKDIIPNLDTLEEYRRRMSVLVKSFSSTSPCEEYLAEFKNYMQKIEASRKYYRDERRKGEFASKILTELVLLGEDFTHYEDRLTERRSLHS